ncbi:MAG TPA: hypothetical protein VMU51_21515 [Mycobacteriales bacterium]|nr:hypothetical protein [Mycobacteriales bacterium]
MRPEDQDASTDVVERRTALRRGAAVLAGVAGLTAAAAATGSAADAAPGDPVLQGQVNNAAASSTALTSTSAATLQVANSGAGAPLRLGVQDIPSDNSVLGDLHAVDFGGGDVAFPYFTHISGNAASVPALFSQVLTDATALSFVPITPFRQVDTRNAAGRAAIVNPTGNLDSSGRLIGGHTITVDLSNLVFAGFGGVFANVTVTGTTGPGFVVVYPSEGARPNASTVNFAAGQTLSNASFTAFTFNGEFITVQIFALVTTHVIFDVTGFSVGNINSVVQRALSPAAGSPANRPKIDMAKAPEWYRRQNAGHAK